MDIEKGTLDEILSLKNIQIDGNSSLELWFEKARYKKLGQLTIDDICRCLRQNIAIDILVPYALRSLEKDILAGDQYDGELASALEQLEKKYWHDNQGMKIKFIEIMTGGLSQLDDEEQEKYVKWRDGS
jgi:hypothetical protein